MAHFGLVTYSLEDLLASIISEVKYDRLQAKKGPAPPPPTPPREFCRHILS